METAGRPPATRARRVVSGRAARKARARKACPEIRGHAATPIRDALSALRARAWTRGDVRVGNPRGPRLLKALAERQALP